MSDDFEWGDLPADSRRKSKIDWESWPEPQVGEDKKMRYPSKFFEPDGDGDSTKMLKNRVDQSWRGFCNKHKPDWKFMSRVVLKNDKSGVEVWRTE